MSEKFLYNSKTNKLHISGYCMHTKKGYFENFIPFNTENEAISYDGRAVSMCKICQKKREKKMEEIK